MRFRVGDMALFRYRYPCVVLNDDHSSIPYFVQFLSDCHPDVAVCAFDSKDWFSWCFKSDLSPYEIDESAGPEVDLSEVL